MKGKTKNVFIIKFCLLICLCFFPGFANASTVTYTTPNSTVTLGDTFTLSIVGQDFTTGTVGGNVDISWDTSILTLDSTASPDVIKTWPGSDFSPNFQGTNTIRIAVGDSANLFNPVAYGPAFDIADLLFTASGPGTTAITLTPFNWADVDFSAFSSQPTGIGGNITVNAVPIPGALWLLGSGLIGMVGLRRKLVN